jgi:hypothetical protein
VAPTIHPPVGHQWRVVGKKITRQLGGNSIKQ